MEKSLQAYRVRSCIPMRGEEATCGKALFAPLATIDDCLIITQDERIVHIDCYSAKALPAGIPEIIDLGEKILVPCAFNAHTHIQLAHSKGKTLWNEGFVPWLKSLIALLPQPFDNMAIDNSVRSMKDSGTIFFADYANAGLPLVAHSAEENALEAMYFAEWFGYSEQWDEFSAFPERVRKAMATAPKLQAGSLENIAPCGHALYSTAPDILQKAKSWCNTRAKPFSMHLAEFPEEVEALTLGSGELVQLYDGIVLPTDWKAPGLAPVEYAQKLGLLNEKTLAVHCVMCEEKDLEILSAARVTVCLCPRSNAHLAVGTAPFWKLANSPIYLCLGTDGLSSNIDLNVWNEAIYLHENFEFPWEALLRMLTVNAAALFKPANTSCAGSLEVGARANWTFLPIVF